MEHWTLTDYCSCQHTGRFFHHEGSTLYHHIHATFPPRGGTYHNTHRDKWGYESVCPIIFHTKFSPKCYLFPNYSRADEPSPLQDPCPWRLDYRPSTLQRERNDTARPNILLATSRCGPLSLRVRWARSSLRAWQKRRRETRITCHWCGGICYTQNRANLTQRENFIDIASWRYTFFCIDRIFFYVKFYSF